MADVCLYRSVEDLCAVEANLFSNSGLANPSLNCPRFSFKTVFGEMVRANEYMSVELHRGLLIEKHQP